MTKQMRFYFNRMHALDSTLCVTVSHASQYRLIREWFRMISRLGDGVFWYVLMLGMALLDSDKGLYAATHMLLAGLSGTFAYKWLKAKTHRPRPYQVRQDVWVTGKPLDHFSFPSGHTLHAVAFSVVALVYYPILAGLLITFTIMVGMSRVILGLHYPSDVIAGAAIGASIAYLSFLPI